MAHSQIAELLQKVGLLDERQVDAVMSRASGSGGYVVQQIAEMGYASESAVARAISIELGLPRIDLALTPPEPDALALLDGRTCLDRAVLPVALRENGELLWLAMADPTDSEAIQLVRRKSGKRVRPAVAGPSEISRAARGAYNLTLNVASQSRGEDDLGAIDISTLGDDDEGADAMEVVNVMDESASPLARLARQLGVEVPESLAGKTGFAAGALDLGAAQASRAVDEVPPPEERPSLRVSPPPQRWSQPGIPRDPQRSSQPGVLRDPQRSSQPGLARDPQRVSQPGVPFDSQRVSQPGIPFDPRRSSQPGVPRDPQRVSQPGVVVTERFAPAPPARTATPPQGLPAQRPAPIVTRGVSGPGQEAIEIELHELPLDTGQPDGPPPDALSADELATLEAIRDSMEKGAMVLRALVSLCVDKGVFTKEEMARRPRES